MYLLLAFAALATVQLSPIELHVCFSFKNDFPPLPQRFFTAPKVFHLHKCLPGGSLEAYGLNRKHVQLFASPQTHRKCSSEFRCGTSTVYWLNSHLTAKVVLFISSPMFHVCFCCVKYTLVCNLSTQHIKAKIHV